MSDNLNISYPLYSIETWLEKQPENAPDNFYVSYTLDTMTDSEKVACNLLLERYKKLRYIWQNAETETALGKSTLLFSKLIRRES